MIAGCPVCFKNYEVGVELKCSQCGCDLHTQAGAEINPTLDDQSSSAVGYIKDMNTKELLADAALEWARLILYLQREYAAGKAEFRIAFQGKSWFIVHPLSKDGQTINVNLNESEDDAIEKHLQEWKRLKDEYIKSKTSGAEDTEATTMGSIIDSIIDRHDNTQTFFFSVREMKEAMQSFAHAHAAKAVAAERKRLARLIADRKVKANEEGQAVALDTLTPDDAYTVGLTVGSELRGLELVEAWLAGE